MLPELTAFHRAARVSPFYRDFLARHGIDPAGVNSPAAFAALPLVDKAISFAREPIDRLLASDNPGPPAYVLTSSGHSGVFAFGVSDTTSLTRRVQRFDALLDLVFDVASRPTLLINGLPMGVKVPTQACTLAETSVRPDMILGLVRAFGPRHEQIILVGDAAFLKATLELGQRSGIDWPSRRVHLVTGEEPLAENARIYLESLLGIDRTAPDHALVLSSMGMAEIGLNLFAEAPPRRTLLRLRRLLHRHPELRTAVFGGPRRTVPMLFTWDPRGLHVAFSDDRLVLTPLGEDVMIPLIRYAPGDRGAFVSLPEALRDPLTAAGESWDLASALPIVAIEGRGEGVPSGEGILTPEAVKEALYAAREVASRITANFRLVASESKPVVRVQLSPGEAETPALRTAASDALAARVDGPFELRLEPYENFGSGMSLDYERKFAYLSP